MNQPEEELSKFEEELTQAMRAVDPPAGFAERTMAKAQASERPRGRVLRMPGRLQAWTNGAIAAALLAGVFAGEQMRVRHQRERAELAQQQFEAAMRITDETLDQVRSQLQQAGVTVGN